MGRLRQMQFVYCPHLVARWALEAIVLSNETPSREKVTLPVSTLCLPCSHVRCDPGCHLKPIRACVLLEPPACGFPNRPMTRRTPEVDDRRCHIAGSPWRRPDASTNLRDADPPTNDTDQHLSVARPDKSQPLQCGQHTSRSRAVMPRRQPRSWVMNITAVPVRSFRSTMSRRVCA